MRIKFEAFLSNIASLGLAMKSCVKKTKRSGQKGGEERKEKRREDKRRYSGWWLMSVILTFKRLR